MCVLYLKALQRRKEGSNVTIRFFSFEEIETKLSEKQTKITTLVNKSFHQIKLNQSHKKKEKIHQTYLVFFFFAPFGSPFFLSFFLAVPVLVASVLIEPADVVVVGVVISSDFFLPFMEFTVSMGWAGC